MTIFRWRKAEGKMENIEIIDLAVMCLAVYRSPGDEVLAKRFGTAVERAHNADVAVMHIAVGLLSGKRYQIVTDNPEAARRARSIAADLGATIRESEHDDGRTQMVFAPAVKF
jgi:hypothetical protein